MQTEYRDISDGDWDSVRYALRRFNERLSAIEGHSGTINKFSALSMEGNQIRNGPWRQESADGNEFITKYYLQSVEGMRLYRPVENVAQNIKATGSYANLSTRVDSGDPAVTIDAVSGWLDYVKYPMKAWADTDTYTDFNMLYVTYGNIFTIVGDAVLTYAKLELPDSYLSILPGGGTAKTPAWIEGSVPSTNESAFGVWELVDGSSFVNFYPTRIDQQDSFRPNASYRDISFIGDLWVPVAKAV